jgi:hypothetical protein
MTLLFGREEVFKRNNVEKISNSFGDVPAAGVIYEDRQPNGLFSALRPERIIRSNGTDERIERIPWRGKQ